MIFLIFAERIIINRNRRARTHLHKMATWRSTTISSVQGSDRSCMVHASRRSTGRMPSLIVSTYTTDSYTQRLDRPCSKVTMVTNQTSHTSASLALACVLNGRATVELNSTIMISPEYFLATQQQIRTSDTSTSTLVSSKPATTRLLTRLGTFNPPDPPRPNSCMTWGCSSMMTTLKEMPLN